MEYGFTRSAFANTTPPSEFVRAFETNWMPSKYKSTFTPCIPALEPESTSFHPTFRGSPPSPRPEPQSARPEQPAPRFWSVGAGGGYGAGGVAGPVLAEVGAGGAVDGSRPATRLARAVRAPVLPGWTGRQHPGPATRLTLPIGAQCLARGARGSAPVSSASIGAGLAHPDFHQDFFACVHRHLIALRGRKFACKVLHQHVIGAGRDRERVTAGSIRFPGVLPDVVVVKQPDFHAGHGLALGAEQLDVQLPIQAGARLLLHPGPGPRAAHEHRLVFKALRPDAGHQGAAVAGVRDTDLARGRGLAGRRVIAATAGKAHEHGLRYPGPEFVDEFQHAVLREVERRALQGNPVHALPVHRIVFREPLEALGLDVQKDFSLVNRH